MKVRIMLIWIQLLIFPIITYSRVITIHQTNTQTEFITKYVQTTLITRWSTLQRYTEKPTSTTTITRTRTTTTTVSDSSISSSTSASSGSSTSSLFASKVVSLHNTLRSKHSSQPLQWTQNLTNFAQSYADEYNCNGTLVHSHYNYGENLALGHNTTSAIQAWYDEVEDYDYNNPMFSEKTGHFTQLVWNSTTLIGCAMKNCGDYYGEYLVCEYESAGNFKGQFEDNVFAS